MRARADESLALPHRKSGVPDLRLTEAGLEQAQGLWGEGSRASPDEPQQAKTEWHRVRLPDGARRHPQCSRIRLSVRANRVLLTCAGRGRVGPAPLVRMPAPDRSINRPAREDSGKQSAPPEKPFFASFYPHRSLTLKPKTGVRMHATEIQIAHEMPRLLNSLAGKGSRSIGITPRVTPNRR